MHDIIQIVLGFDHFVGQIMKPVVGSADYRIVRVAFFSALAVWSAFGLASFTRDTTLGLLRITFIKTPIGIFGLLQRLRPEIDKQVNQFKEVRVSLSKLLRKAKSSVVRGRQYE